MERTGLGEGRKGCFRVIACGILVIALLLVSCAGAARPAKTEVYRGREVVANEVIVKFRGASPPELAVQGGPGDHIDEQESVGGARAVRLHSRSRNVGALIQELSARTDVEYVEPNYVVHALAIPDDPLYSQLWGLPKIGAPAAWDITTGTTPKVVAVVDTGIDYTHPDLAGNVWSAPSGFTVTINGRAITCPAGSHGYNAIADSCNPMDDHNHGTHVSGTIAATGNNGAGVAGVNWRGSIMGLKFLDASGSGTLSDAIDAIEFAIQAKEVLGDGADIRVLSNSWGGGEFSQALLDEINEAAAHDMLFVAAAGNSASNNDVTPMYPASYTAPGVVAVAATDSADALAYFSSYGAASVDLGAPGVSILSTVRGGQYATSSGTSMATPHVSGAALLVLSKCSLDIAGLKENLLSNVDPVSALAGKTVTGGRLNVNRAISACAAPRTPTTTTLSALPETPAYGVPVTFTAVVTPMEGTGTPTGTVTFFNDTVPMGTGTLAGGQATFTTTTLAAVTHGITASYSGDAGFSSSASPVLFYTVSPAPTTLVLIASREASAFGEPVTLTATVTPPDATGWVTFAAGETTLGKVPVTTGTASLTFSTLPAGSYTITATYSGNINYLASSADLPFTVSRSISTVTATTFPNPSIAGQWVNVTATVSPPGATGTVTFSDGDTLLGSDELFGGMAWYITPDLSVGTHTITAVYGGDSNVAGDTSAPVTHTVNSVPPPDFSLSASPGSLSLVRGTTGTSTIAVKGLNGFSGAVNLVISGTPAGATATLTPVTTTGTSTLTVASGTAAAGTYTLVVTGTSGSLTRTSTVTVTITDFTLSLSPSSQTVVRGKSTSYTVTVGRLSGFSGDITLSVTGLPSRATATFSPKTVTNPGTQSILTVATTSKTPAGTYTLTVTGTSGTLVRSSKVTIRVNRYNNLFSSGAETGDDEPTGNPHR